MAETLKQAQAFMAILPPQNPAFLKVMLPSHVSGSFWLDIPSDFCRAHLPNFGNPKMRLIEHGTRDKTYSRFLCNEKGLTRGWQEFSKKHQLIEGDVLVFELTNSVTFKVYIFRGSPCTVNVYALQCKRCFKWRVVKTLEEYEEIRSTFREDPFFCNKKQGISCDDPCDIEYDNSRTWAVDKPNLPKTPNGLRRNVEVRRDFSGCDVHYEMPNGERVRSLLEARKFLESHPEYKSRVSLLDFEFTAPVIMKDTIPGYVG